MNKKLLVILPLSLVMVQGAPKVTAQDQCEPMDVPPVCQNARKITINVNSRKISPRNICVDPGQEIPVQVKPRGSTVTIEGKMGGWPSGSGEKFVIIAPEEGEHDYNVYFEDGSCIDPRVTVK